MFIEEFSDRGKVAKLKKVSSTDGFTYKGARLRIDEYSEPGTANSYFVAFRYKRAVALLRLLREVGEARLHPEGINDFVHNTQGQRLERWQKDFQFFSSKNGVFLDLGVHSGKGVMSALHAHALDRVSRESGISRVYRESIFSNPGWKSRLLSLGAAELKHGVRWNLDNLREKRPWAEFLLTEERKS